ncbi:uncharacterized protein [Fopius arisanus]|nr:PREDICTED: uncharacterized protein LOC105270118 isoform X2 [Fopius arisanus]XP_011309159.1 PREDICTED: uncharacterized protein LOC105270118 isoform X2 [Fopius arisanus]
MFAKPMRTYQRKPVNSWSRIPAAIPTRSIPLHFFSDSEDEENDKQEEPLDDTFDRLRKTAKPVEAVVSSQNNDSTNFYSTSSSDSSELEVIPIPQASLPVKRGRKRKTTEKSTKASKNPQNSLSNQKVTRRIRGAKDNAGRPVNSQVVDQKRKEKQQVKSRNRKKRTSPSRQKHFDKNEENDLVDDSVIPPVVEISDKRPDSNRRGGKNIESIQRNEISLHSSSDATSDCWVSLHRLKLANILREKNPGNHSESPNSQKSSVSVLVSLLSEDELNEEKENKFDEEKTKGKRNLKSRIESLSLFSTDESLNPNDSVKKYEKEVTDDSLSLMKEEIIEKTLETKRKPSSANEGRSSTSSVSILDNCSVVLQRYDKLGKSRNSNINQTLWSSTPVVSRIRQKGARLQLSPIPVPSSGINPRNNQLAPRGNQLQEQENRGKENIETDPLGVAIKLPKSNSVSIIDEDTEEEHVSTASDIILTRIVDNSLKQKIEQQLFSSVPSIKDSIDGSTGVEPSIISGECQEDKLKSSVNTMAVSNSSGEICSPLSDKVEGRVDTSSSGTMSPLMFEDSGEDKREGDTSGIHDSTAGGIEDEGQPMGKTSGVDLSSHLFSTDSINDQGDEENNGEIMIEEPNDSSGVGEKKRESTMMGQLPEALTRLPDSVRVSDRRHKYRDRDNRLSAISENTVKRLSEGVEGPVENDEDGDEGEVSGGREVKSVFLKPGKSWARSLSILNHLRKEEDLEAMAAGKGKNWRQSVANLLNMQSQGIIQSCISNNADDKIQTCVSSAISGPPERKWSANGLSSQPSSPGRFIRRVSIRVVPDNRGNTRISEKIQDSSFLEAYGITTGKDRQTLVQKPIQSVRKSNYNFRSSTNNLQVPEPTIARNVVLERCNQMDSCPFSQMYPEEYLDNCRKIGEGVYGEVFLFDNGKERSVIKIIPIEGSDLVNGEPQKKFDEILSEIIIAKELHDLRVNKINRTDGFVEVKNIRCLRGRYPDKLVNLWEMYDEEKNSENDCPSMFKDDQLYIALELGDGGKDLEAFIFQNASEAFSSFIQTALTLAVAEKSMDFEHRDLHWGNILISRTNDKLASYKLNTEEITFPCQGIKVSIIDFTFSRMSYEGCCIFNDLALDPSLFTAVGDYQFEIYRLMRAQVKNTWQVFQPYTNLLWLHYLIDKMITVVRYKRTGSKIHQNHISKFQELKKVILDYDSAFDFVYNCQIVKDALKIR